MNNVTLIEKFFTGGNATFTVDNGRGEHYTFKIRQPKGVNTPHFASLLTGPDNEHSFTYLGVVCAMTGLVRLTKASKYDNDTKPVKVLRWALSKVFGDKVLPDGYNIRHAGKCGCCGRTLTEPESLSVGIGPECRKKLGM